MPTLPSPNRTPRHPIASYLPAPLQPERDSVQRIGETARLAMDAFKALGGCICADELAARLSEIGANGVGTVARWLVKRQVVVVQAPGGYWLPRFQFVQPAWAVAGTVPRVLRELTPVMSDAEIAEWFYTRNEWLKGKPPASALADAPAEVGHAARVQRFLISI